MHPNPDFTYRDAVRRDQEDAVILGIQFFDQSPEVHEGHLLAYINLMDLIVKASDDLVSGLCGSNTSHVPVYSQTESSRAARVAAQNATAKKVMEELGLWTP